jgi:metal-responsive CopG/Arc/MetJ family transcriptional regulator
MKSSKPVLTENISVSIQAALLDRLDKYCALHELQKSQVISKSLKKFLAAELADDPLFWEQVYDNAEE